MRLNIPTNADGYPIVSHIIIDSLKSLPVQHDAAGYFVDGVNRRYFFGLLRGSNGALWEKANS
jgi:hypothetical protein